MESAFKDLHIRNVWRLHLTRNAIMPRNSASNNWNDQDGAARFYMFDYFDKLVCRPVKWADNDYRFCFGLNQPPDNVPPTASHYLTLLSFGEETANPFEDLSDSKSGLSDMPFLSIILVTVIPDKASGAAQKLTEEDIREFLDACAQELHDATNEAYREFQKKQRRRKKRGPKANLRFCVYHCLNSGNFCVVVRTNRPELSYYVAMRIRGTTLNKEAKFRFPPLSCWTFSLTGIEYKEDENRIAIPPDAEQADAINAEVVMRFSLPNQTLIRQMYALNRKNIRTLYGRYDVTLTLKMEDFRRIYPWLCAGKFNSLVPTDEKWKLDAAPLIKILMDAMEPDRMRTEHGKTGGVQAVNERILVNADSIDADEAFPVSGDAEHDRQSLVRGENLAVMSMMENLLAKADSLPWYRDEFCHSLHLLRDLWKSYSSLRYQEDSFINGNMFLAQIWLVLDTVEKYIDSAPEIMSRNHPDKVPVGEYHFNQIAYRDLIRFLRASIQSISHFQKLMQSINQQSLMAPNYEIQMHTDLEKFMVSYTEFSRRFLCCHFRRDGQTPGKNDKQHILPVFMMDVQNESIQAEPQFLLPYWQDREGLCHSNPEKERLLLSIILPDIETFGDLYATLPLICHELSHNFRVILRKERNEALCRFILHKVANYVVTEWISTANENSPDSYAHIGLLRDWISFEMADCLYDAYTRYCEPAHEQANIGALNSNMKAFLANCFFMDTDGAMSAREAESLLENLCALYRPFHQAEHAKWYADFLTCRRELREIIELEKESPHTPDWSKECLSRCKEKYNEHRRVLSRPLRETAVGIYSDIVEQQSQAVSQAAWVLAQCAEKRLQHMDDSEKDVFRNVVNELLNTVSALYSPCADPFLETFPTAEDADNWIIRATQRMTDAVKRMEENIRKLERADVTEESGEMELLRKNLLYVLAESCGVIKDANHLWNVLWGYASVEKVSFLSRSERTKLFHEIHLRLRNDIQCMRTPLNRRLETPTDLYGQINGKNAIDYIHSLWPLFLAPQMRKLLTPVCIDMEDESVLVKTLSTTALRFVDFNTVKALEEDCVTLYREVFADLGMCLSLNLDAFGYLMVMSHHKKFYQDALYEDRYHSLLERIEMVCWTLSSGENLSERNKTLKRNILTYRNAIKEHIQQSLNDDGFQTLNALFFQALDEVINEPERAADIQKAPSTLQRIPDWMRGLEERLSAEQLESMRLEEKSQMKRDLYRKVTRELEHLWMSVYFTSRIRHTLEQAERGVWRFHWQTAKHFESLWEIMRTSWNDTEQRMPSSHVLRKIGEAYNSGKVEPFLRRETPNDALKDTLSFVLFYYYQNWNIYGREFPEYFRSASEPGGNKSLEEREREREQRNSLNEWLERLMEGGESV